MARGHLLLEAGDPEINNQILRARPDTYRRGGTIKPTFKEMGTHGVFSAEGEEWKQQRRLAMRPLAFSKP